MPLYDAKIQNIELTEDIVMFQFWAQQQEMLLGTGETLRQSSLLPSQSSKLGIYDTYTCPVCSKRIKMKHHFTRHLREAHKEHNAYKCEVCGSAYKWYESLRKHRKEHHPDYNVTN